MFSLSVLVAGGSVSSDCC